MTGFVSYYHCTCAAPNEHTKRSNRHRWKTTLAQVLAPFFVVLILYVLTIIVEEGQAPDQYVYPRVTPYNPSKLRRCYPKYTKKCVTVRYTTNGDTFAASVMDRVLSQLGHVPSAEIVEHVSTEDMLNEVNRVKNSTLYAVTFLGDEPEHQTMLPMLPPNVDTMATRYIVYYNATSDDIIHENMLLHTMIDNSIAAERLGRPLTENLVFNTSRQGWPKPEDVKDGQLSVFSFTGPQFFSICSMIILIMSLHSLVVEKEQRLRFGMKMMGLRDTSFYISWFASFTLMCFVASLVTVFSGMIFQIVMFLKTNWFVLFAMFFTFGMSLVCLAFLLSTLVNTGKSALILGFVILAVSFILNLFVANGAAVYQMYNPVVTRALPIILCFYPPFDFAKIFSDISYKSLPEYNKFTRKYTPGPGFQWSDLYGENEYFDLTSPPTANSFYILLGLSAGFLIIAWYLDNVLPGATGISRKPWFFLMPSFYGIRFDGKLLGGDNYQTRWTQEEMLRRPVDDPVRMEYENVRNPDINYALRIVGLKKTYTRWFGLRKSQQALKGLNLGVLPGTCVGYLGKNGAGKSTTMNILTGLIASTGGDAFIFGKNVKFNMDVIRKKIGVCPQHDILWDNLTAREHLLIFGLFKGGALRDLNTMMDYLLGKVNLLKWKDRPAGSYSGGMKRRLSVCIACIGDPELILLDEPTTGMDPYSRRQVWDLIQEMKGSITSKSQSTSKQRVIVLTTHAMDEAEALCDRISIVADGQMQAIGDGLSLKKQYGDGYTLSVMAQPGRANDALQLITPLLPSNTRSVSQNAGSFIYQVPKESVEEMGPFLERLETESQGEIIKDWGISHTTMEQVYLVVADMAEKKRKGGKTSSVMSNNDIELPNAEIPLEPQQVRTVN